MKVDAIFGSLRTLYGLSTTSLHLFRQYESCLRRRDVDSILRSARGIRIACHGESVTAKKFSFLAIQAPLLFKRAPAWTLFVITSKRRIRKDNRHESSEHHDHECDLLQYQHHSGRRRRTVVVTRLRLAAGS